MVPPIGYQDRAIVYVGYDIPYPIAIFIESIFMTNARYSMTAMILHWLIALALTFQIALGWQFETLERGANLFGLYQLHKSIGIAILVLSLARLFLRYTRPRPAAFADNIWSERAAKSVHLAFYAVMIGGPLTGWMLVSTAKIDVPTLLFGTIPLPHLPIGRSFHEPAEILHELLAWGAIALLILHVAGALRHQFFKQENILGRMIPWAVERKGPLFLTLISISAALGFAFWTGSSITAAKTGPVDTPALNSPINDNPEASQNLPKEVAEKAAALPVAEEEIPASDAKQKLANWQVSRGGKLGFSVDWNGTPIAGSFGRWTSDIRFSPDDLTHSAIIVNVDLGSASTSDAQRDEMLLGDSFFNVAVHPKAVFTSSSISNVGGDKYRARGTLKLHGKAQPLTLDFRLKIDGSNAKVSGTSRLKRTAFGVGSGEWAATDEIADNVSVSFDFAAKTRD